MHINSVQQNLESLKRHHVAKIHSDFRQLSLKRKTWKQRKNVLESNKSVTAQKRFYSSGH